MNSTLQQHRYLVALPRGEGRVFLSWRLLSTDRPDTPFHLERRCRRDEAWQRMTSEPILESTNFLDVTPEAGEYQYRIIAAAGTPSETVEVDASAPASMLALDVPLNPDDRVQCIVLGDLNNDGRMGYVLRSARSGTIWICAYGHDGKSLWEIDTGLPASGGWDMLHVPFLCWDVNDDGRTEVAFHSYKGKFPGARYDTGGADEFLTVVDAETGELAWETQWPASKSRVMMTVGHLRGLEQPAHLVVLDETYRDVVLTAVDGKTSDVFWRIEQARPAGHNLDIADIDGDGVQEVICGGICYNGDGTVRWEAEPFGHTDISKPARIDPNREGLQIWYAVESHNPGVYFVDKDGKTIFKEAFRHAHYGWIAKHTAKVPGLQPHTAEDARREGGRGEEGHFPIFLPDGSHWLNLTEWQRKNFVPIHWDEAPEVVFIIRKENKRIVRLKEIPPAPPFQKGEGEIEDLPDGKLPEGGEYGRNLAGADVIGDFRENIVTVDTERHRLIVLVNPTVAHRRGYSPYTDFEYRHDRSQHGSGYYIYLSPPER